MVEEEAENEKALPHLPDEIITANVLPRLPVKSLLRFRCVCKSWLRLIANPKFIRTHVQFSSEDERNNNDNKKLIICCTLWQDTVTCFTCSLHSLVYKRSFDSVNSLVLNHSMQIRYGCVRFVGSCNGLCCISIGKERFVLWNPCTKESHLLPPTWVPHRHYGFGYDEINDDYKVVQIWQESIGEAVRIMGRVYSLRANSWRTIEGNCPGGTFLGMIGAAFVKGNLHWDLNGFAGDSYGSRMILALDLAMETLDMIPWPAGEDLPSCRNWSLGVFRGFLSVTGYRNSELHILVLRDYSVRDSWTKMVSLRLTMEIHGPIIPLSVSENHEILLNAFSCFLLCNSSEIISSFDHSHWTRFGASKFLTSGMVTTYVESLVSPIPDNS